MITLIGYYMTVYSNRSKGEESLGSLVKLAGRNVTGTGGRKFININKEALVRVAGIERKHSMVDVFLNAFAAVAGS